MNEHTDKPNFVTHTPSPAAHNKDRRENMKHSLMIGAMLGIVTATALYCGTTNCSFKKAKKALVNKIEDIIL